MMEQYDINLWCVICMNDRRRRRRRRRDCRAISSRSAKALDTQWSSHVTNAHKKQKSHALMANRKE